MGEEGEASGFCLFGLGALDGIERLRCVGMDGVSESACFALIGWRREADPEKKEARLSFSFWVGKSGKEPELTSTRASLELEGVTGTHGRTCTMSRRRDWCTGPGLGKPST